MSRGWSAQHRSIGEEKGGGGWSAQHRSIGEEKGGGGGGGGGSTGRLVRRNHQN